MKLPMHRNNIATIGGFTLVELLISLAIFSIVLFVSGGTLVTLMDTNAKAQELGNITTNLSFALDRLTREMRMSYHYYCYNTSEGRDSDLLPEKNETRDCPSGKGAVAFVRERDDIQVAYRLNEGKIERRTETEPWLSVTPENVVIDNFQITVDNSRPYSDPSSDETQPTADILVQGHIRNTAGGTPSPFSIQTHIVARRLDIL